MIPALTRTLLVPLVAEEQTSRTWKLNRKSMTIEGFIDGQEAMEQAAYRALNVERYRWVVYSPNYGIRLRRLIGKPRGYSIPEVRREVTEALLWDTRFVAVGEFDFTPVGLHEVLARYVADTIYGQTPIEMAVPL